MTIKHFLLFNLIIFSIALKDKKETIYRAMAELNPALQIDSCEAKFTFEEEEEDQKYLFMKPCQDGYHCGNKINDISSCIPNVKLQKFGEKCNYDNECILGHCDEEKKVCTFSKNDKAKEFKTEETFRCGNGLFYSSKNNKCVEKSDIDYLEGYCIYTKNSNNAKEVNIEPNKPFYVCGESGYAEESNKDGLKPNTLYVKMSEVGSLKTGTKTSSEYACEYGAASLSEDGEFWICDEIEKFIKADYDAKEPYIEYQFKHAGKVTIKEDNFEYYIYQNKLNGTKIAYTPEYHTAFNNYIAAVKKYKKYCNKNTHEYYFSPFDCDIKQIYDNYFYVHNMEFFSNNTEGAKTVMNSIKQQEFDKRLCSSGFLSLKFVIFGVISLFYLL